MAQVAAVKLGDWLEEANIGAVWLLIGFVFVTFLVDFIMPAAIAKWAILAPSSSRCSSASTSRRRRCSPPTASATRRPT